jgi:hypothetical protein
MAKRRKPKEIVPGWIVVLEAVRRASHGGEREFSSFDLVPEAGFRPTRRSSAVQIASGWLSKLTRWGYVRRKGAEPHGKRWVRLYALTKWGKSYGQ